jgi:hypothetical protein
MNTKIHIDTFQHTFVYVRNRPVFFITLITNKTTNQYSRFDVTRIDRRLNALNYIQYKIIENKKIKLDKLTANSIFYVKYLNFILLIKYLHDDNIKYRMQI